MFAALKNLLADLAVPSPADEAPYDALVIAVAHAVLGAALVQIVALALPHVVAVLLTVGLYWIVKESADLRRGGTVSDGLFDTAMICAGGLYGAPWWPVYILALATLSALDRARRNGALTPPSGKET